MAEQPLKLPRRGGDFGDEIEASEVDPWFLTQLHAALKLPLFSVPKPFETWMIDKVASSGFDLPISQVVGFSQFTAQAASPVQTSESTTSTSYADLATAGPSISGLADGAYVVFFGCVARNSSASTGGTADMSVKVNATEASDNDYIRINHDGNTSIGRAIVKTLDGGGNNTLTARYKKAGDGTAFFEHRWMIALRYANA